MSRAKPTSGPTFVTTIPLATTPRDRSILAVRMEMARHAYNALLRECLRRLRQMRESAGYRAAKAMKPGKERTAAFRESAKVHGFGEYDLYAFIQSMRKSEIGHHIDSHTCKSLAARAFAAVERRLYKGGWVRFRRRGELRSVEGRSAGNPLRWDADGRRVIWSGLSLPADIDPADEVIAHGLRHRVRYARIVRMVIRGLTHYYVQLVQKGEPFRKPEHRAGQGTVGLDIGPSTIAVVSDVGVSLDLFCAALADRSAEIKRLQRQESRKRFLNNPDNFERGGKTIRKGKRGRRVWKVSRRQKRLADRRAELQRRELEHRRTLHATMAHRVLAQGNDVRTEKLSYKGFQRAFGKSVGRRAPGMFLATLRAQARKLGATVTEFEPRRALLSQTCPSCGQIRKKKLSDRVHECACGCVLQRDIASAHLARFVVGDRLDTAASFRAWLGDRKRLCAVSSVNNSATVGPSGRVLPGTDQGRAESHVDLRHNPVSVCVGPRGNEAQKKPEEGATGRFEPKKRQRSNAHGDVVSLPRQPCELFET